MSNKLNSKDKDKLETAKKIVKEKFPDSLRVFFTEIIMVVIPFTCLLWVVLYLFALLHTGGF